jgi:hypothetical protein
VEFAIIPQIGAQVTKEVVVGKENLTMIQAQVLDLIEWMKKESKDCLQLYRVDIQSEMI